MLISLSTIINTTTWTSLLTLFLLLFIRKATRLLHLSLPVILAACIFILIRLLIPVEFFFTHTIAVGKLLPDIYAALKTPLIYTDPICIRLFHLLGSIWFTGSVILFIRMAHSYYKLRDMISNLEPVTDESILSVLNTVNSCFKKPQKCSLLMSSDAVTPFITGFSNPVIVIPDMGWTPEQITHILKHELHHFYRGHLKLTFLFECIRNIYFWNPLIHLLVHRLDDLLELDADKSATDTFNEQETLFYMECLLHTSRMQYENKTLNLPGIAFTASQTSRLNQRIHYLLDSPRFRCRRIPSLIFYGVLCILTTLSLLFICEPYSEPEEAEREGLFVCNDENSYFIQREDGTYDLYYNDTYMATVKKPLDSTIPIKEEQK